MAEVAVNVFNDPKYWCGELGYRPGADGVGYRDFPINDLKMKYLLARNPKSVLEVGCAFGFMVARLRRAGVKAFGMDVSEYALAQAPQEAKGFLKCASADQLPYADGEFDIVYSASVLEHLPAEMLAAAIKEIVRVGKRGVISVTPGDSAHFTEDPTHQTRQPLAWWREQFPPQFEVRDDADEAWLRHNQFPIVSANRFHWLYNQFSVAGTILDIGCADKVAWEGTKYQVTTVDINPDFKPDVVADAASLPLADRSFDVVVLGEILEHVDNPCQVLKEAARVGRRRIVVTCPWEHVWPEDLKPFWNPGHKRFYTPETLEEELAATGLPHRLEVINGGGFVWLGAVLELGQPTVRVVTPDVPSEKMVKLNLGSFVDTIGKGWVNMDILALEPYIKEGHLFRRHDLRAGLPYGNDSVDLIRASHLIEHLTLEEGKALLVEIHRVLKPGGLVRISTPDVRMVLQHFMKRDMSYYNAIQPLEYVEARTETEKLSRILFSGDYAHRCVYDLEMMLSFLNQAGFTQFTRVWPGHSYSTVMLAETEDQHVEVNLTVEARK